MHAILRQKTLLGETYVQLIPEGKTGPYLTDGGQLANSQVEPSVTLDDILSAFDPKTSADFKIWQQAVAEGINGRGEQINASFAQPRTVRRTRQQARRHPRQPGRRRAGARAQHGRRLQRARQPRPPARRPDRQRRTHLQSGRRRQPGVRRDLQRAARLRAQLAGGAQRTRPLRRRREPVPRRIPSRRAPALLAAVSGKAVRAAVRQIPHLARAADEGRQDRAAGPRQIARPDRARARKPQAGAAQPRPVPAVHRRPTFTSCRPSSPTSRPRRSSSEFNGDLPEGEGLQAAPADDARRARPGEPRALQPEQIGTDRSNAYPLAGTYNSLASGLPVFSSSGLLELRPRRSTGRPTK